MSIQSMPTYMRLIREDKAHFLKLPDRVRSINGATSRWHWGTLKENKKRATVSKCRKQREIKSSRRRERPTSVCFKQMVSDSKISDRFGLRDRWSIQERSAKLSRETAGSEMRMVLKSTVSADYYERENACAPNRRYFRTLDR